MLAVVTARECFVRSSGRRGAHASCVGGLFVFHGGAGYGDELQIPRYARDDKSVQGLEMRILYKV
jgi:hypothetical protein